MNKAFNSLRYKELACFPKIDHARIALIKEFVGKNQDVLDLGCGDGFITEILAKNNRVLGVDLSGPALALAKKRGLKVKELDLLTDWAKDLKDKYDVVLAAEILEHVFDTDKFLTNLKKVLKKDGHLVISTPNVASLPRRLMLLLGLSPYLETTAREHDAGHIRYFTFAKLKKLLEENGFEITEFTAEGVTLSQGGNVFCGMLAKIFPTLGRTLIIKAKKI